MGDSFRARLLAATDVLPGNPSTRITRLREHVVESLRASLEGPAHRLRQAGWQVECRVVDDFAASAILDTAEESEVDGILMSTHGRTGWRRLVNGSVAERVMRHSRCRVILVNAHWRAEGNSQEPKHSQVVTTAAGTDESS